MKTIMFRISIEWKSGKDNNKIEKKGRKGQQKEKE